MNKLTKDEFDILKCILKNKYVNVKDISNFLSISLSKANKTIDSLNKKHLIRKNNELSLKAKDILKDYKVDNAIILAAGMSTRFVPFSYEKPKGLLKVKGEVLIERQIKQLKSVGINKIYVVVGYMKEKFYYLEKKYNVKIVFNKDYYRYNSSSSLIRVLDKIKNSYICSSDNYFVENVFEEYVYNSYYSVVHQNGKSNEYGVITSKNNRIKSIDHKPNNMLIMQGHVYFNNDFSTRFRKILLCEYSNPDVKSDYWEKVLEKHLKELEIYAREYDSNKVLEFDSLDDLKKFDKNCLFNNDSHVIMNICTTLKCNKEEISKIYVLKNGLTNMSFKFSCNGKDYVYRYPGKHTNKLISRNNEYYSMKIADEIGLDKTIIYMDRRDGWKISKFIKNSHTLNYSNPREVKDAISLLKKLHNNKIKVEYDYDLWGNTLALIKNIDNVYKNNDDFMSLFNRMKKLKGIVKKDRVEHILCHCDCYNNNFLFDKNGNVNLIDWEYSGNYYPGCDVAYFISSLNFDDEQYLKLAELYEGHVLNEKERWYYNAVMSIVMWYWFVWALYKESIGKQIDDKIIWYRKVMDALERI